jgi:hypothetical protein
LKQLRNGHDEELANIISSHQELESSQPDQDVPLLPDMEPFRLGQPLEVGKGVNYIGGLDGNSSLDDGSLDDGSLDDGEPVPEYAMFTSEEEESDSDDSNVDI